jgi:hypothetical protein
MVRVVWDDGVAGPSDGRQPATAINKAATEAVLSLRVRNTRALLVVIIASQGSYFLGEP